LAELDRSLSGLIDRHPVRQMRLACCGTAVLSMGRAIG
jgi:hypothetical protein